MIKCSHTSTVHLVNSAYTSQIDSFSGLLIGTRKGDRFYRTNGEVIQADWNAAPHLHTLKADVQELFQSNRLYTLEQVKQFRKKLGGFNTGLAVKNEYVFMP